MAEPTKKTYYLPKKLSEVFAKWCKPGRDYSPKIAGAMLAWMTLEPAAREKIVGLAYSDNLKKAAIEAKKVLINSVVDAATPSGLTVERLLYSMRHVASPAVFQRVMQDIENIRAGGQIIAEMDAASQPPDEPHVKDDDAVPLDVAIARIRTASTQYELLSPENQKWLDDFRVEAIVAQRLDTPADRIVADAHRKSAKKKAAHKGTASRKSAKSPRSAG